MIDISGRPEYNPLGTVRGSIGGGSWVLTGVFLPTPAPNMWVSVLTGEHVTHLMISLSGMPVIGAVPGTPAWELWKNYRMSVDTQCTAAMDLVDGPSRCTFDADHPGQHSFQDQVIRLCAIRRGLSYCRRLRGHDGPCAWPPDDGDHEDTYQ